MMYASQMHRKKSFLRASLVAPALHVFFFCIGLGSFLNHPLLLSRLALLLVAIADFPMSLLAGAAMFRSDALTPYALTAWLILGTTSWYFLGLLIEVKLSLHRRKY
jgi:hypothetical protein